ncbi:hypothetical protein DSL64_26655 [Dyadobacter luteus]|uniref:DUF4402 domain-containing protein n=1 Tax=Dyadobacter luteus TaxID=2259619 RepID=A0A3D8Y475_9BACT|nr:hypothetical protein [Dyadobacter luteus]REA56502.1 hypothetical protein DSL64_26655 [Dyadobacter luteus]
MRHLFFILLFSECFMAMGQKTASVAVNLTLPAVALIDIVPSASSTVALKMTAPTEAGQPIGVGTANSANWLIMTSAVTAAGSRNVSGSVVGTMPPGIRLRLDVSPYTGTGLGFSPSMGYVTTNIYMTNTATKFIDNIKGSFTGTGTGSNGFRLRYSIEISDYAAIRSGTTSLTVRYTMADN